MTDMKIHELLNSSRSAKDAQILIDALPYAKFIGMQAIWQDQLQFKLPPLESNIGNPTLPAIHGGAVAGFMEMAAAVHLLMMFDHDKSLAGKPVLPKIVDFSIDYIRACRFEDTYAQCEVVRQGRRIANVGIRVWQQTPENITATARAHYLLSAD